jgi:hypothetical protein
MLEKLHRLAVRLAWIQPLAAVVGILALLVSAYLATGQETLTDQYLIPAILLFCWCLLIYTLVGMFITPPPVSEPGMGFFMRLRVRFYRLLRTLVAVAFLSLTVALALLSYRLISIGIG